MQLTDKRGDHLVASGQLTVGRGEGEHGGKGVLVSLNKAYHRLIKDLGVGGEGGREGGREGGGVLSE